MSQKSDKSNDINIQKIVTLSSLAAILAITIVVAFLFSGENFAIAYLLLVIIWFVDAFLKSVYEFENSTVFADLSLASLAFSASHTMSLIALAPVLNLIESMIPSLPEQISEVFSSIAFTSFPLNTSIGLTSAIGLLWIANLTVCQSFNARKVLVPLTLQRIAWLLSSLFAANSVYLALFPYLGR